MNLERGALLHGRYRIVDILGEGGMGAVYRAIDENLGVEVAVKENFFTSEEYARQFHREATILASLRHPNLPRVTDHFVIENQGQYLVMDFMEGEDLRERLDRLTTLPEEDTTVLGVAICDALTYMHTRDPIVLHRDIKPGNVKVTPSGHVSLVDFGLAKIVEGNRETTPGARAMTPGYSPPEQYGTARTDPRSDIYSLGATLYEVLTADIPEDGLGRVMEQATLTPLRKRNPEISKRLAAVIEKALAVHPEDRYQTAEEFKKALINASKTATRKQFANGELTLSPPPQVGVELGADEFDPSPVSDPDLNGPIPVSAEISLPEKRVKGKKTRVRFGRLAIVLLLGLILGLVAGIYFFFPDLSAQALSLLSPSPGSIGGGEPPSIAEPVTSTSSEVVAGVFPTITMTPSPVPSPTATSELEMLNTPESRTEIDPIATLTLTPTPTPTPLGGGSGEIAFASDRTGIPQIWIINSDGTRLRRVTDVQDGACQPSWAPDGSRFVFISPCERNLESYQNSSLFVINADGTDLRPLPTILGGDYDPAWSPDGRYIAFTSLRQDNRPQIFLLDMEDESVKPLSEDIASDFQPDWSADSSQIVFISTRRGPFQIWVSNINGEVQELFSRSGGVKNSYPRWSPDGQVVVFNQQQDDTGVPTLVATRFENETYIEFRIFHNWVPSRDARFSADGIWLAFESWPDGENHDIYIMTPNRVGLTRLTSNPANDFDPDWRPSPSGP